MSEKTPAPDAELTAAQVSNLGILQNTMDDLTSRIADHPKSSLAVRLARGARAGVPEEKVRQLLGLIRAALNDAEATYDRALEAPVKAESIAVPSRASLL